MVFFNYATMQMAAKIVYYGPGLCGKTTNLHWIYAKTAPQGRGEMVSLETETDRTLFFDLLPIDVGVIGGFKTRLQLYTVPGQVFYNTTRKLVLKGVDGVVFVADLQRPMLDANLESFRNLRENLSEIGVNVDEVPLVLQLNKKDLPNTIERETLVHALDPDGRYVAVEASAVNGEGVFDTLKEISKLTLRTLRRRMMGDEAARPAQVRPSVVQQPARSREAPVGFNPPPAIAKAPAVAPLVPQAPMSVPAAATAAALAAQAFKVAPPLPEEPFSEMRAEENPFPQSPSMESLLDPPAPEFVEIAPYSPAESQPRAEVRHEEPPRPAPAPPEMPTFAPVDAPVPAPPVKHVKLRSTAEIFAELDSLRKMATQGGKARPPAAQAVMKSAEFRVADEVLKVVRRVHVALLFEDGNGNVVQQREAQIDLESDQEVQNIQLQLKIDKG
jgi:mutual gliding-motility protein MglA